MDKLLQFNSETQKGIDIYADTQKLKKFNLM